MRKIHHAQPYFRFMPLLLVLILIAAAAACHKGASSASSAEAAGPPWSGKMVFSTDPAQPISGKDTAFRLVLMDDSGQPLSGADVKADLKMRTMDMGKNVVTLTDHGDGVYQGNGQFTMAGPWDVIVSAKKGSKSGWQSFPVVAKK